MKIRVLHIIKTLDLGGAETNLFNLVQVADPSKVVVHVAYSAGGEIEEKFKKSGVALFKYASENYRVKSIATLFIILKLVGYIRKNKIHIIHTHNFSAHIWGSLAAKI